MKIFRKTTEDDDREESRFELEMPKLVKNEKEYFKAARDRAINLTESQLKQLKDLTRYISIFRFTTAPINAKILPVFYDLGLFTGSTYLWRGAYEWILIKDKRKYEDLNLDLTLLLMTAVLAGGSHGLGANRWYRMGITRKLLKHLIELIEAEQSKKER